MKIIPVKVPNKKASIPCYVDDEDYTKLGNKKWCLTAGYPSRCWNGKTTYLHRIVMGASEGEEIDHEDGNKLNAQKKNLRFCTRSQNNINRKKIQGVTWHRNAWMAQIGKDRKNFYLGRYKTKDEAVLAYREKAKELYGSFTPFN